MEIVQKRLSNKHTFTFEDNHFNFAYKDKSGSGDVDITYANVPDKHSTVIEQNEWLRNIGLIWGGFGVYDIASAMYQGSSLAGTAMWLILGVICFSIYFLTKAKFSVYKTEQGSFFIIKNSQHNGIIKEIKARKKQQLLKWYGEIDLENDQENEIEKFRWLAKQNVITETEAEEKIAQVEFAFKDPDLKPNQLN